MLTYQKFEGLEIIGYFDSNFAGCQDSKHYTFEYIYILAGRTLITPLTMTAEFVTYFEASNHGIYKRKEKTLEEGLKKFWFERGTLESLLNLDWVNKKDREEKVSLVLYLAYGVSAIVVSIYAGSSSVTT
ncbi:hypothetical protein CR513_46421, partial [Mucuna pruriens]